jgi:hypothetical protein
MRQRFNFFGAASNLLKINACWSDRGISAHAADKRELLMLSSFLSVAADWRRMNNTRPD